MEATMFDFRERIRYMRTNGYVVFAGAIDHAQVDQFWNDVEWHLGHNDDLSFAMYDKILKNADVKGEVLQENSVLRIIDLDRHSEVVPRIMLHPIIQHFLVDYYQAQPTVLQTLTYKFSSQQGAHSDLYLVSPGWAGERYDRSRLMASWLACEDATEANGGLVLYPGSHLLPKRRLDEFASYGEYVKYLEDMCSQHGIAPKVFEARKGDVLFWHGDFVHAGGPIQVPGMTRKSLVVHYGCFDEDFEPIDPKLRRHGYGTGWYYRN
jgi:ectoine hydroxylase-related dioxygenase (phytanoyl-CoA dioxygenase family)